MQRQIDLDNIILHWLRCFDPTTRSERVLSALNEWIDGDRVAVVRASKLQFTHLKPSSWSLRLANKRATWKGRSKGPHVALGDDVRATSQPPSAPTLHPSSSILSSLPTTPVTSHASPTSAGNRAPTNTEARSPSRVLTSSPTQARPPSRLLTSSPVEQPGRFATQTRSAGAHPAAQTSREESPTSHQSSEGPVTGPFTRRRTSPRLSAAASSEDSEEQGDSSRATARSNRNGNFHPYARQASPIALSPRTAPRPSSLHSRTEPSAAIARDEMSDDDEQMAIALSLVRPNGHASSQSSRVGGRNSDKRSSSSSASAKADRHYHPYPRSSSSGPSSPSRVTGRSTARRNTAQPQPIGSSSSSEESDDDDESMANVAAATLSPPKMAPARLSNITEEEEEEEEGASLGDISCDGIVPAAHRNRTNLSNRGRSLSRSSESVVLGVGGSEEASHRTTKRLSSRSGKTLQESSSDASRFETPDNHIESSLPRPPRETRADSEPSLPPITASPDLFGTPSSPIENQESTLALKRSAACFNLTTAFERNSPLATGPSLLLLSRSNASMNLAGRANCSPELDDMARDSAAVLARLEASPPTMGGAIDGPSNALRPPTSVPTVRDDTDEEGSSFELVDEGAETPNGAAREGKGKKLLGRLKKAASSSVPKSLRKRFEKKATGLICYSSTRSIKTSRNQFNIHKLSTPMMRGSRIGLLSLVRALCSVFVL